tara:strand:- start:603 stop:980 length:378 start_codon:yes stop_codon:yes gene_type:complete
LLGSRNVNVGREVDMASTPEGKVKKVVTEQLKQLGAYYFSPMTGGYGKSGVPDIIACYNGYFFGIECKAGNNKPTALQNKNLDDIEDTGGFSFVINEDTMDKLADIMWNAVITRSLRAPQKYRNS